MNNKTAPDICIFYLCAHKRFYEKAGTGNIINNKDVFRILGEVYHIPKVLRVIIIEEMIKLKMLKKIDKDYTEILPLITDPEININRFYKEAGFFK